MLGFSSFLHPKFTLYIQTFRMSMQCPISDSLMGILSCTIMILKCLVSRNKYISRWYTLYTPYSTFIRQSALRRSTADSRSVRAACQRHNSTWVHFRQEFPEETRKERHTNAYSLQYASNVNSTGRAPSARSLLVKIILKRVGWKSQVRSVHIKLL
jgi:hypothetical protein